MIRHLAAPVLGLAVLVGAAAPVAADRGGYYVVKPAAQYSQGDQSAKNAKNSQKSQRKRKFDPKLDFETEAVWRNLRPEWFD